MSEYAGDARADAERYAADLREWAASGFVRGLAGWRTRSVPRGETRLPSEAFHDFASKVLSDDRSADMTRRQREAYLAEVEEILADLQRDAVEKHNRLATLGGLADVALSVGSVIGLIVMMRTLGSFHPAVFAMLAAMACGFLALSVCARRAARLGRAAFHSESEMFSLPWIR